MHILGSFGFQVVVLLSLLIVGRSGFVKDMLDLHNKYRSKHGTPHLYTNEHGGSECEKYAEELAIKHMLVSSESLGEYGENLCYSSNPLHCVHMWYDEIKDYDFDNPRYSPATEHFTQLIWRDSEHLAVGKTRGKDGMYFVVARYRPAGNLMGHFRENVPRNFAGRLYYPYLLTRLVLWLVPSIQLQVDFQLL